MKKIITLFLAGLTTIVLTSCNFNKSNNAEKTIKETQVNIINKIQQNIFAQKNIEYSLNLSTKVITPMWSWELYFLSTGENLGYTWLLNVKWNIKINDINSSSSLQANFSTAIINTLKKFYLNIHQLEINSNDPNIISLTRTIKILENKWLYTDIDQNYQVNQVIKNINIKNLLQKYSLLKVDKIIWDKNYKVELNKKNILNIITEINKQINSNNINYNTGDFLKNFDLTWDLKIQNDKLHFEFSGFIKSDENTIPFQLSYLKNKFKLSLPTIIADFDINWEDFDWYILINSLNIQIPVKGSISPTKFALYIKYDSQPTEILLQLEYKIKKTINKLNFSIPQDSINIKTLLNQF